jgi:hypothetical protein
MLVSSSRDETIKLWDARTGLCLNTLSAEKPYAGMNIAGVMGITAAQQARLIALGVADADG